MIKRVIAAVAALALAGVGLMLILNYANRADERALADQETTTVLVATDRILQGTPADELATEVVTRQIPQAYVMSGAAESVDDLAGLVAAREILPDQQIAEGMFVPVDQLRRASDFVIPQEAELLHQLTIDITNPRALGGSIAAGDLVGIFGTFDEGAEAEDGTGATGDAVTYTDLIKDKALVVRVEGGYVPPVGEDDQGGSADDTLNITLALAPQDAARVIFARETAGVWLTLAPEDAEDAQVFAVVPAQPARTTGAVE